MTDVILNTSRLSLVMWHPSDIALLQDLHSNEEQTRYVGGGVWTREKAQQRMAGWLEEHRQIGVTKYKLLDRASGEFVGRAGFSYFNPEERFELGYSLKVASWGRGFATEISVGLRDWFFARPLADEFIGFTHPDNGASMRVLQKIGMRKRAPIDLDGLICPTFEIKAGQIHRNSI